MKIRHLLFPACAAFVLTACDAPKPNEEGSPAPSPTASPEATPASTSEATEATEPVVVMEEETAAAVDLPDPVAEINGEPISRADFEKTLSEVFGAMGLQPSMLPAEQQSLLYRQFIEDLIVDRLIDAAAANTEVTDAEVDEELSKIAQQYGSQERLAEELSSTGQTIDDFKTRMKRLLRQRKWMDAQTPEAAAVTDTEVEKFYNENINEFAQPEVVRASHILIRVEEDADEATVAEKQKQAADLAAKAKAGEDFAALATEFSEDPTAKQNAGDLNFFPKDRMVPEFAEAAFAAEVNSISEPVRTQFGWHVIKVTDKKAAQTLPLAEVKEDIAEYLKDGQKQKAVEGVIANLRSQAQVKIHLPEAAAPAAPSGSETNGGN
jgi:peptidyl-prolyl cis-trans isomerase C